RVPFLCDLGDVGAKTIRLEGGISPGGHFGDNTGIPCPAGCSASARYPERKDCGQNQRAPERPATQPIRPRRFLEIAWYCHRAGNHVEQNIPLSSHRDQENAAPVYAD